ncbi:caprin-2 [Sinocyclocheilus grahami]|uniref:caprin-2 n=1 Tax=Sinocyclocheilus grahami TaxID=75366 RepID=UPI0007AD01B7|nr:PREDICTED: caprin-2 [Sinocyclocheilus grahami]
MLCSLHIATKIMVQLSPSRTIETLTPSELTVEKDDGQGSPKSESPRVLTALQFTLSPTTTTNYDYEKYIEDGLICLKHKIRNIEKKKLKLESYSERLKKGEKLNQDQLEAVGKYEEVIHNLKFAKELQKTIGALTQDLLKAQHKVARQEKVMRIEEERKHLNLMLQVQYVLHSLQREDVRRNFCNMRQHSCYLSTQDMESLLDLASLLGFKRDHSMSLEDQMEQAAIVYWELLEGKEEPVAGSTYKHMKEKLLRLVDCGFFDHVPLPKVDSQEKTETLKADPPRPCGLSTLVKLSSKEVPSKEFLNRRYLPVTDVTERRQDEKASPRSWKEEFLAMKEREPPDSWEMEFSDPPASSQSPIQKPWKGAAGLIPKTADIVKRPTVDPKEKRQRKSKEEQDSKPMPVAVEVFSSPLPKDPAQRKQQLESLMDQISGSFSFMQESLLDGETSPVNSQTKRRRPSPGSSTPLVYLLSSSAGWSDSSQVSSPDREGAFLLDSGISDTLSIPPMEVPITPQGPHTLMPVHVYPLTRLRVAFSAARTANFAPGTMDQPIAFDLLHTNLGDMFDTTTGRFTCPAAGAYVFIFHILKLAISVPLYINLMRNEEVMVSGYANDGAPDHETASNHAVLQLFQGDQVWLRLHRGAIYGSSWKYSTFSGFLLYQD